MALKVWAPAERLLAADLNGNVTLLRTTSLARGSANPVLTTTYADITGLTLTLGAGTFLIQAIADLSVGTAGVGSCDVRLMVDGVAETQTAVWQPASTVTGEATVSQVWRVTIAGAGVVKLQVKKSIAAGAATMVGAQSALTATLG